ncbi:MAG: precorrin-2 dehydrogenase/sirohydrochlorin ferrochelatase family protein [Ruminococcus sp.]|jgi:precorrin-2 dehydrogenase/sirohydrochlorin ferrochelatase
MKKDEYGMFPLFVDLSEKKAVVIGAGKIASRRIETLAKFTPNLTVVADRADEKVKKMAEEGILTLHQRKYQREDLFGADLVIAGTDDHELNGEIYSVCKCLGILVNVISDRRKCDFHFPGIVKQDRLVIGVNAGGNDHRLAKEIRERIEKMMGGKEV